VESRRASQRCSFLPGLGLSLTLLQPQLRCSPRRPRRTGDRPQICPTGADTATATPAFLAPPRGEAVEPVWRSGGFQASAPCHHVLNPWSARDAQRPPSAHQQRRPAETRERRATTNAFGTAMKSPHIPGHLTPWAGDLCCLTTLPALLLRGTYSAGICRVGARVSRSVISPGLRRRSHSRRSAQRWVRVPADRRPGGSGRSVCDQVRADGCA
jgi:hypothetical protein